MSSIAIITARGGSKRIPKKNIKEFCGKPIIAYSIEAALQSGVFDEVMVSTDSQEIASIAREFGANIPFLRSEATSNDFASTVDVLKEVVEQYEKNGCKFDILCCIYPTAPFVTSEKLKDAVNQIVASDADALMPVVQYSFPPQRSVVIRNLFVEYQFPEFASVRSQDLEAIYHDCGQFYVCRVLSFNKYGSVIMPKTIPMIMSEEEVQDIDNISDWHLAELKYKAFMRG